MNPEKLNVAVLCGGKSGEHEISLLSAKSVISAIDRKKYKVIIIGISKDGDWRLMNEEDFLLNPDDADKIKLNSNGKEIFFSPSPAGNPFRTATDSIKIDVVFPVLHGTYGEDGTVQGMLDMLNVPYVGANYLGSAAAMDKDIAKRLFMQAGLKVAPYLAFNYEEDHNNLNSVIQRVEKEIGYPCFVKPANLGSSVGTNKAKNRAELLDALGDAWKYDLKILVEKAINAREIECSVLGNANVETSELGEIVPRHEFYSYEAKYLDPNGAELIVGAKMDEKQKKEIQEAAKKAFKALCCEGMARADFLVDKETGTPYINELNTIPGFTKISMYPKLMEKSGIKYTELIDRLIELALKRYEARKRLKTDFKS